MKEPRDEVFRRLVKDGADPASLRKLEAEEDAREAAEWLLVEAEEVIAGLVEAIDAVADGPTRVAIQARVGWTLDSYRAMAREEGWGDVGALMLQPDSVA